MTDSAPSGPSRSIEIEKKFDVDEGTQVPDWSAVAGVSAVSAGEARHLDALYYDTADAALGRQGVALRRRTGGHDAGWHIKGPLIDGGRVELGWPLGESEQIPDEVLAAVAQWTAEPLSPLARIVNDRTAYDLLDEDGGVLAEFVDDRVSTTDLRGGAQREWSEWEVELGAAAPVDRAERDAFFDGVARVAVAAGARDASSASKLARALGL